MANGRSGRPAAPSEDGERTRLTLRWDGGTKSLAVTLAAGYGMTVAEYLEALVMRDAGENGHRP